MDQIMKYWTFWPSFWLTVFQQPVISDIQALKTRVNNLEKENHKYRDNYYRTNGG